MNLFKKWWFWVILAVLLIIIIYAVNFLVFASRIVFETNYPDLK